MSSSSSPTPPIPESKEAKAGTTLVHTIETTLAVFAEFKSNSETEMYANYLISQLIQLKSGDLTEVKLNDLSEKLDKWSKSEAIAEIKAGSVSFNEALKQALLILPRNVENFATADNITPEHRIITSDRYQFDIRSIVKWINEKGSYNNPYTGAAFKPEDQKSIYDLAIAKGLPISVGHAHHAPNYLHETVLAGFAAEDAAATAAMAVPPVAVAPFAPPLAAPLVAGMFAPPPAPPTVGQLQVLSPTGLAYRAAANILTANLIFNTPHLRAALLVGSPYDIKRHLACIACCGVAQATLIFNTPDLRAHLLFAPPGDGPLTSNSLVSRTLLEIARRSIGQAHLVFDVPEVRAAALSNENTSLYEGLKQIVLRSLEQALLIFNDAELREHLLTVGAGQTLNYIAQRYPQSDAIQTLCALYMPALPHHHHP